MKAPVKYLLESTERVNLGNYEFIELKAAVEFSSEEAVGDPTEFAQGELDAVLLPHRRRALSLLPEDSISFLLDHPALER